MTELPGDAETLFRAFMDRIPVAAWVVDAEDRLVYASEPWPLDQEQLGTPIFDLVPPEFAEPYRGGSAPRPDDWSGAGDHGARAAARTWSGCHGVVPRLLLSGHG